jgi:hypothetical protein
LKLFYRTETAVPGRTKVKVDGKNYDPSDLVGRVVAGDVIDSGDGRDPGGRGGGADGGGGQSDHALEREGVLQP